MPEETQDTDGYAPIEEERKSTKYLASEPENDTEKKVGEKYIALEAEEAKTWWDNQTNRTIIAVLISVAFIALIAALVFLLPCTEDDYETATGGPNTTAFTEVVEYE
ncbi:hypothetical protein HOLleu_17479 [Holothuria leucospilota]|uniref:Uncharacterized protein n=1 Tax=Holothuria leucospilota TaxID=206669 RepID=A0A9Q1C1Q9_HOLLE|nr:hypothetical protein HOLleu_17479 [Holothuria leucospilota]